MRFSNFKIILFIYFFVILACLGTVSAKDFTQSATSKDVQDFIDTSIKDNIINFQSGNYTSLKELNITRNLTIQAQNNAVVNIKGDGKSTLFNVESTGVTIKNLNIIDYAAAINSTENRLTVQNNKIMHTNILYNTTGVIINIVGLDDTYNNDNLIENNLINTTKDSIILNVESLSFKSCYMENNTIKNNTIISWLKYAIYSNTTANIKNLDIVDSYLKSSSPVIVIVCENLRNFGFKKNIVRSESEHRSTLIDIRFKYTVENVEIVSNDIYSNWQVNGITMTTIDSSIITNMTNINIKDNVINASLGSIVLSPTGKIENLNLTNNNLSKDNSNIYDHNYLVTIGGAYVSNLYAFGNDFKGNGIRFNTAKGNFTVENNEFYSYSLDYAVAGAMDNDINDNILINNNTGTFSNAQNGSSLNTGFLDISVNSDLNNFIITNNNIIGGFGYISTNNGLINRFEMINNTGRISFLNIYSNVPYVEISNNNLGYISYTGRTADNSEIHIKNNIIANGHRINSNVYAGISFSVGSMNAEVYIVNNTVYEGSISVSGNMNNTKVSIINNIAHGNVTVSGSLDDDSEVYIKNNTIYNPFAPSVSGNQTNTIISIENNLLITDSAFLSPAPSLINLTGNVEHSQYTITISSPGYETVIYIDGVILDSLTITINSGCKARINIINSNITSLTINDYSTESYINITNNNFSKMTFNFYSNNKPNVYISDNNIYRDGVFLGFGGEFDSCNITFKNNNITGTTGVVVYSLTSATTTVRNLNISDNYINVSGYGVDIANGNAYGAPTPASFNFYNLTISNNIINSGNHGIYFRSQVSITVVAQFENISITNNFINASNSGIYYYGTLNGLNILNNNIENNTIYAGQNGIQTDINGFIGFNLLSNDILANVNGIYLTFRTSSGNALTANYNSIVANGYLLFMTRTGSGTHNINYNWWGSNNVNISNTSKFNNVIASIGINNYYIVTLDSNNANKIGDYVLNHVSLNNDDNDNGTKLPNFYITINNNGKIQDVLAKGGEIEVLSSGVYIIKYHNSQLSNQTLNLTIGSSAKGNTYLETSTFTSKKGEKVTIYAILKNANGVALTNKEITFKINGKTYTYLTDSNGRANFEYNATDDGYFNIEIIFAGDNDYTGSMISINLNVTNNTQTNNTNLSYNDKIQKMIDDTPIGGTLYLTGDYKDLHLIISKSITIYGGKIVSSLNDPIFTITGSGITLIGFDLSIPNGVSIDIKDGASNIKILNNHIHDSQVGVVVNNALYVDILNNEFIMCRDGIDLRGKGDIDYIVVQNNFISGKGTSGPGTTGDRNGGSGNGIIIDSNIPQLLITRNIITNNAHGIILDIGLGNGEINLYDSIFNNLLTSNHRALEATAAIRGVPDPLRLGPNWYGGTEGAFSCPRLSASIPILVNLISVDDHGNVLVYFYYIDYLTGEKVIVTDLPPIPVEFSLNNIGRDPTTAVNGTATFDYTDRVYFNAGIGVIIYAYVGVVTLNITLTSEEILAGIEQDIIKGNMNFDGSWANKDTQNNNTNNNNGTGTGGTGTGGTNTNTGGTGTGGTNTNTGGTGTGGTNTNTGGTGTGGTNTNTGRTITGTPSDSRQTNANKANSQGYQGTQVAQAGTTTAAVASSDNGASDESADKSGDNPDAYEITPKDQTSNINNNTVLITIILIVAVLGLIVVGIVRRKRFV